MSSVSSRQGIPAGHGREIYSDWNFRKLHRSSCARSGSGIVRRHGARGVPVSRCSRAPIRPSRIQPRRTLARYRAAAARPQVPHATARNARVRLRRPGSSSWWGTRLPRRMREKRGRVTAISAVVDGKDARPAPSSSTGSGNRLRHGVRDDATDSALRGPARHAHHPGQPSAWSATRWSPRPARRNDRGADNNDCTSRRLSRCGSASGTRIPRGSWSTQGGGGFGIPRCLRGYGVACCAKSPATREVTSLRSKPSSPYHGRGKADGEPRSTGKAFLAIRITGCKHAPTFPSGPRSNAASGLHAINSNASVM